MSPTKLLDEVTSALARHGPTLIVHLLLFVWVGLRVLDPGQLPRADAIWNPFAERIDTAFQAVGLSLERWYVLAALVIAYLVAVRGIRNLVTALPLLRIPFPTLPPDGLLKFAAEVLRVRPEPWKVSEALRKRMERVARELQEPGSPRSYLWSYDRVDAWYAYYGTLLLALGGAILWWVEGATYARSAGRVLELVTLLAICCIGARWKTRREMENRETALAYWALDHLESEANDPRSDPLRWERGEIVEKQAEFDRMAERHPVRILSRQIHRWLPTRMAERASARLRHPRWTLAHEDWDLFESEAMMYGDEERSPPKALRVDELAGHFEPLLECAGAGLFMLAPASLGLAPSVDRGGASYCLGKRRHGEHLLPITLQAGEGLADARLMVQSHADAPAFLVEVGEIPIEQLAQLSFPYTNGADWHALVRLELEPDLWARLGSCQTATLSNLKLAHAVDLHVGSSYLLGARTALGTRVSAVMQIFRVANQAKVLVAWRILRVVAAEATMPTVLPWWRPAAWKDVVRA